MKKLIVVIAMSLCAAHAAAHDFWIEPGTPMANGRVPIRLMVGHELDGDAVPRRSAKIARFEAIDSEDRDPVAGFEGRDPAGIVTAEEKQTLIVIYESNATVTELSPKTFARYCDEEGLESIMRERTRRGEAGKPARDRFSRHAKTILRSGQTTDEITSPAGMTFEIVPELDPTAAAGATPFRLLYRGRPAAGVLVVAVRRGQASSRQAARTDSAGRVGFKIDGSGDWLIKAVYAERSQSSDAEWNSYWASLTFRR